VEKLVHRLWRILDDAKRFPCLEPGMSVVTSAYILS